MATIFKVLGIILGYEIARSVVVRISKDEEAMSEIRGVRDHGFRAWKQIIKS